MTMSWSVEGVPEFESVIDAFMTIAKEATRDAVVSGAHLIEANTKASFGPVHARGTPKTDMTRPQSITGNLRRSVEVVESGPGGEWGWAARLAPQMIYSRRIELGFPKGVHAYPYLTPGGEKSLPYLNEVFTAAWSRALRS